MIKKKLLKIFSFNGVSLIIGILGSLASILAVFVTQWDSKINLKWFVFALFLALTIIIILLKLIFDLNDEIDTKYSQSVKVVRYLPDNKVFLISKTESLGHLAMVSIFYLDNAYEAELGKGYVKNIQENFIQIKIISITTDFESNYQNILQRIESNDVMILEKIIVKNYITYSN
jgi:hypothetical protein